MNEEEGRYDFEQTLMYGRYSELAQFAKEFKATQQKKNLLARNRKEGLLIGEGGKKKKSLKKRIYHTIKEDVLPHMMDWTFLLLLGIAMAMLSFLLDYVIEKAGEAHIELYRSAPNVAAKYVLWVLFSMVFILFSVGFVNVVSPNAIGSGIPEMKTVLRGINLTGYLSFRTLISKSVGLITSVGSGLPIGKEGPFVHMSSILAHQMSRFITNINKVYVNEAHNYELLAAACAVGVSCNFAAPIGGVLFSIEVTATYFAVRNYWRGFFGAVCGAFLFRLMAVWVKDEETITALFKTNFDFEIPFDLEELPAFAFIGVVAGFAGSFFVWYHRNFVLLRRRYRHYTKRIERNIFIFPMIITFIITTMTFPGWLGRFMAGGLTQRGALNHLFSNITWRKIPIDEVLNEDSIQYDIADNWRTPNIFLTLVVFMIFNFIATGISNSLPTVAGVFFPVFVLGAAFGRLTGEVMDACFPNGINCNGDVCQMINPGGYAVVGAAAMAGAVTHTISTSVIVFELTGQITHILPVMIAVLIANAIASLLQPSFYDSIILIKELPYLPDLKKNINLYVTDIMRRDVVFVSYGSSYKELRDKLNKYSYSSFALVDSDESRILLGSIQRSKLEALLDQQLLPLNEQRRNLHLDITTYSPQASLTRDTTDNSFEYFTGNTVNMLKSAMSYVKKSFSINSAGMDESDTEDPALSGSHTPEELTQLEEELLDKPINFAGCQIDPSPFQLVERTSLYKVHSLFSLLTLSHSYVTSIGRLIGVVTLPDLCEAIETGKGKPVTHDSHEMTPSPLAAASENEETIPNND